MVEILHHFRYQALRMIRNSDGMVGVGWYRIYIICRMNQAFGYGFVTVMAFSLWLTWATVNIQDACAME